MDFGRLLQALTNAVLALYDQPEPGSADGIYDISGLLDGLAAARRGEEGARDA